MTIRLIAGAAVLALGLGLAGSATARPYQPGMRTMVQQGGVEHGVQPGLTRRERKMMKHRQHRKRMMHHRRMR